VTRIRIHAGPLSRVRLPRRHRVAPPLISILPPDRLDISTPSFEEGGKEELDKCRQLVSELRRVSEVLRVKAHHISPQAYDLTASLQAVAAEAAQLVHELWILRNSDRESKSLSVLANSSA